MENDMRVTLPLWQMGFIFLLMIITVVLGFSTEMEVTVNGFEFEMSIEGYPAGVSGITLIIFLVYLSLFLINIKRHNERFPERKISSLTFKPQEYLEDDELFDEMTKRATKKVYTYYSWALPLLVGFSLGGFLGRTVILVGILLLVMGQYWIFYTTMKKTLKRAEEEE